MKPFFILLTVVCSFPAAAAGFDLTRPEIQAFIADVAARNKLDRDGLTQLLAKAQPQPKIIELISKPAEKVAPWWQYRDRFLTEERIARGVDFYVEHREALEHAAAAHGVAPEYIVGILGVETFYGRITGRYRVLDALATLAFDYPPRSEFFRKELEQFVLLSTEEKLDPLTTLGSYAGAMGVAQFMPSSYRRLAVDGDADGHRDLWADWPDVFASIANYFHEHGWQPGGPVLSEARLDPDPDFQFDPRNLDLNTTIGELNSHGVRPAGLAPLNAIPAVLISAEQKDGPAYRIGFQNFHVITRYNRSVRYAMAVHELAQAIATRISVLPLPPHQCKCNEKG